MKFDTKRSEKLYQETPDDTVGSSSEGIGWAGLYQSNAEGGWILAEDTDGFVTSKAYQKDPELEAAWKEICSNLEVSGEPDEEDFVIEDCPQGYTMKGVVYNSIDEAIAQAKEWMEQDNFHPNVWYINDHGNINIVDLNEHSQD